AWRVVLLELAHIELEYRLKGGEAARVEEYARAYPELAQERELLLDLIEVECKVRRRREAGLDEREYLQRFPQYRADLGARLHIGTPLPAVSGSVDSVVALSALLRDHRLLEVAQLEELALLQRRFQDPRSLARELVKRTWLTPFQVNKVFQGRTG